MGNPNTKNTLEKLSKYEKELEMAKNSADTSEIFQIFLNLGKLCYEIEAYELGLKYILEAIELSKKYSDFPTPYEFYKLLGDFNFEQGLLDDAYDAYNRSNKELPKKKNFLNYLLKTTLNWVRLVSFWIKIIWQLNILKKQKKYLRN